MDLVVTRRAGHEGLASPFRHEPGPCWLAGAGVCEVGEPGDVVHLHLAAALAQLAPVPLEPGNDLFAGVRIPAGSAIDDDRGLAPFDLGSAANRLSGPRSGLNLQVSGIQGAGNRGDS